MGEIPYSSCDEATARSNIQAGITPPRYPEIPDPVWEFLEKCWSVDGGKRPSAAHVRDAFSRFRAIEELPYGLELEVQSIKIPFAKPKTRQFYVKFEYGDMDHTTPLTTKTMVGGEHTWFAFCPSPHSLSLSPGQGVSRNLVDRNRQMVLRRVSLLQSSLPDIYGGVQEG